MKLTLDKWRRGHVDFMMERCVRIEIIFAVLVFTFHLNAFAGNPARCMPPRPQLTLIQAPLAEWETQASSAADRNEEKGRLQIGIPRTLALEIQLNSNTVARSEWENLTDGSKIWGVDITSPGARGIKIHLESIHLPPGAEVVVYDPAAGTASGRSLTGSRLQRGEVWSDTVFSDTVRLECFLPPGADSAQAQFSILEISHIYKLPQEFAKLKEGTCHNDVTCYPEWAGEASGVARIVFQDKGTTYLCTGCLLASKGVDAPNYFLTAHHCLTSSTVADTVEFYWFYQTSVCNGDPPDENSVPRTSGGGDLLKGSSNSDFAFLRLNEPPPLGTEPLAWSTRAPGNVETLATIHHPDASYKRISFGRSAGALSHFWQVQWYSGVTEPGSSGAPLLNSDHQVIGQLYGGLSACDDPSGIDKFGRFDLTYPSIQAYIDLSTNGISTLPTGIFNGLFFPSEGVTLETSGFITVTVSALGKFTGSLRLSGAKYSFAGQFDPNGAAQISIQRRNLSALNLALQVSPGNLNEISGNLSADAWISSIELNHPLFNSKTNPSPELGVYHFLASSSGSDAQLAPIGDSFFSVTVDGSGKFKLAGFLADGTSTTESGYISTEGLLPLFATPYSGTGLFMGWVNLRQVKGANGQPTWIKPASEKSKIYPDGFSQTLSLFSSTYVKPASGTPALNFSNGFLEFSGVNLASDKLPLTIAVNNKVTTTATNKLSLSIAAGTGLVAGKVQLDGFAKPLLFKGMIDTRQNIAGGYILGTNKAGLMILAP